MLPGNLLQPLGISNKHSRDLNCKDIRQDVGMLISTACVTARRRYPLAKWLPQGSGLIFELRDLPYLVPVIRSFASQLPENWTVFVFHGSRNKETLRKAANRTHALGNLHRANRLVLIDVEAVQSLRDPIEGCSDLGALVKGRGCYNCVMTSSALWSGACLGDTSEWVLTFQADSALCSASEFSLEYFTRMAAFDFFGAPGKYGGRAQNGGLSLRRRSVMKDLAYRNAMNSCGPEDVWFARVAQMTGKVEFMAPWEVATAFSTDGLFEKASFGVHQPRGLWFWDRAAFFAYCPEARAIQGSSSF